VRFLRPTCVRESACRLLQYNKVCSIEWSGFPSIFFVKAGSNEPLTYDGERTAKGLWKYIKKHATKAQEIRERMEKRKGNARKAEEL